MSKKKRLVPASEEEVRMAAKAEKMKEAGFQSFDSVYGDTTPGSFDPVADAAGMAAELGMMDQGQAAKASGMAQTVPMATMPQAPQNAPQAPPAPTQAPPSGEAGEPQEEAQGLSDDPAERCQQISQALSQLSPNPPSAEQLLTWKRMHGDIFLVNVGERAFVFRYLKRQEWIQINANPQLEQMTDLQTEEMVFNKCVLWPQMDIVQTASLPANAIGMVVQQIRIQSLFLDPGYVATLTLKI
jgi:hypothetical protein